MRLRKPIIALLIIMAFTLALTGCGGGGSPGPGGIVGFVCINAANVVQIYGDTQYGSDYRPLAGVTISLDDPTLSTVSSSDGSFSFDGVSDGTRNLSVINGSVTRYFTCIVSGMSSLKFTPFASSQNGLVVRAFSNSSPTALGDLTDKAVSFIYSVLNRDEGYLTADSDISGTITFNMQSKSVNDQFAGLNQRLKLTSETRGLYNSKQTAIDFKMRQYESDLITKSAGRVGMNHLSGKSVRAAVGTVTQFWVDNGSAEVQINATCQKVGAYCYIFVDNNYLSSSILNTTAINNLAEYYDNTAYLKDTSIFGNSTDTDGDSRIYILFSPLARYESAFVAGYFWARDKFSALDIAHSNMHDMIYLTVPEDSYELSVLYGVLPHEYQHMINFDCHYANGVSEMLWLNEGLSELAGFVCNLDSSERRGEIGDYMANPQMGLTLWYNNPDWVLQNYVASRLFLIYLYDRFYLSGEKPNLMHDLVNGSSVGITNVENRTGIGFNNLYRDWVTALVLSDTGRTTDPRFQYRSINLQTGGLSGLILRDDAIYISPYNFDFIWEAYVPKLREITGVTDSTSITISSGADSSGGVIIAY